MKIKLALLVAFFMVALQARAEENKAPAPWYEKFSLKGYTQVRYNRIAESNSKLACNQCDKSIGNKQGIFVRRARLVFSGRPHERVFVYIQPDFASDAATSATGTSQNYLQVRDAYFDYSLTHDHELRLRLGIAKVPYGWDVLQSSSQRAPLDRSDAINSAIPNERDTGVFLIYSPVAVQERFKEIAKSKGSGDYGMVQFAAFNGQTANKAEQNNDLHRALRLAYPFKHDDQYFELGVQAYEGRYVIANANHYDQRTAYTFVWHPRPIGFQAEYNHGKGPQYDVGANKVKVHDLNGGYAMVSYAATAAEHRLHPYFRYQWYKGGKKLEDGRFHDVREWELGSEWAPVPAAELTVAYVLSDRLTRDATSTNNDQSGRLLRLQAQFNY